MTTRRNFLKVMLAAAAAPAIVKASSLMPIHVPKPEIFSFGSGDWTVEGWLRPTAEQWMRISTVRKSGKYTHYLNGVLVDSKILENSKLDIVQSTTGLLSANLDGTSIHLINPKFQGNVSDIRIRSVADIPNNLTAPPDKLFSLI